MSLLRCRANESLYDGVDKSVRTAPRFHEMDDGLDGSTMHGRPIEDQQKVEVGRSRFPRTNTA